jgi:putative FmdB family regulatory protein|tara:strand:- start:243 stop:506 length:264 start_codon:yes stop_codon:yes gene_type:complete
MPKYFYLCENCGKRFTSYHGMEETTDPCPACNTEDLLKKIPSLFSKRQAETSSTKTGLLVKDSIEEFKEDLLEQKEKLKNEVYEKNE